MNSRPTRAVSVGVLTCVLVLTGCSKETPAPTTSGSASSSASSSGTATGGAGTETPAGDEVRGRSGGFTVVPPEGWAEATDKAGSVAGIDLVLLSSKKVGSFANNLVVITTEGDQSTVEDELSKGREQMGAAGRTVSEAPEKSVAGATATGFTTAFEQQGIKVLARSYGVEHGGKIYLLTLSSSQEDASHAMSELDEILATWAWT